MSFSASGLVSKLDALTATQDSITSTAQWVLFYRRHAKVIVESWCEYVESHPKKSLALLYLANDVVQQAKARAKAKAKEGSGVVEEGFVDGFGKVLPKVINEVYSSSSPDNKERIVKLVKVWKDRGIFETAIDIKGAANATTAAAVVSVNKEKLTAESVVSRFQRLHHETLASGDKSAMKSLEEMLTATIEGLQELQQDIEQESKGTSKRQQMIDEQRRKTLAMLQKKQEEEMLPTYEDSSDEDQEDQEENEDQEDQEDQKTVKRLRFAEN